MIHVELNVNLSFAATSPINKLPDPNNLAKYMRVPQNLFTRASPVVEMRMRD